MTQHRKLTAAVVLAVAALALAACHKNTALPDQSAAAKSFLAENAKQPGVVVLPDGLQYKIVRSGPATGQHPHRNDEVKVNYEGKLIDGKVFDSSYERGQPAAMKLADLVPGWVEALQLMRPGDEWILYVPPALGYGEQGGGDVIPPNAALIFRIELIDFLPADGSVAKG